MTAVETSELRPVAEQASHSRIGILSVGTLPQLRGFEARTQRSDIMFTKRRKIGGECGGNKNQASLALVLTFPDSRKANHNTLKSS